MCYLIEFSQQAYMIGVIITNHITNKHATLQMVNCGEIRPEGADIG